MATLHALTETILVRVEPMTEDAESTDEKEEGIMTNPRTIGIGVVLALLATAAFVVQRVSSQTSPPSVPAYTVLSDERAVNPRSNLTIERHKYVARKSDGSRAMGTRPEYPDEAKASSRMVILTRQSVSVEISDATAMKSTTYFQPPVASGNSKRTKCAHDGLTYISDEILAGLTTHKHTRTVQDGARMKVENLWYAPSLNCLEVGHVVDAKEADGTVSDHFERLAKAVIIGEPDAALFQIPDYVEVPPSQRETAQFKLAHPEVVTPSPKVDPWLQLMDRRYYDSQKYKPVTASR